MRRSQPFAAQACADADAGPERSSQDVAFLQYTSGSTSEPKGVMIGRSNLAHNLSEITAALRSDEATVCVSWLPQYHDMGLIGSYLGTLYCGGRGYHSSPLAFVRDPTRWLRDMTTYRATHVQAPSFAYGLAARKFLESATRLKVDLGRKRVIFSHLLRLVSRSVLTRFDSFLDERSSLVGFSKSGPFP